LGRRFGISGTKSTRIAWLLFGLISALGMWLTRFDLLLKDNKRSSVYRGAQYIDINGFFSTLNYINITTIVLLGVTAVVFLMMRYLNTASRGAAADGWREPFRKLGI